MIKKITSLFQALIFLSCFGLQSQNEATKWYFGNKAGLDFSTNPPTALTGNMISDEGCASIADANGNLLFYTNGVTVFNKVHGSMSNGTGLMGHTSTSQGAIIIKKPGSSTEFYIFTISHCGGSLRYSIVDMSLQGGLGAVVTKNVLVDASSSEKLTAARHCNGTDYWIITHNLTTSFRVFLLSSSGFNPTPVVSTLGGSHSGFCFGCMKVSPDRRKIVTVMNINAELFDFNNSTGVVSNFQSLVKQTYSTMYGCEFSHDGTKVYVTYLHTYSKIFQWDLCAGSPAAIAASMYTISVLTPTGVIGAGTHTSVIGYPPLSMQRAPDGKIYIARWGKKFLSAIADPNLAGAACNYQDSAVSIAPNDNINGLPNLVDVHEPLNNSFISNQSCNTLSFTAPSIAGKGLSTCSGSSIAGLNWEFDDPASGTANTSTLTNPVHVYTAPGPYTVKLTVNYPGCAADSFQVVVNIPGIGVTTSPLLACAASASVFVSGNPSVHNYLWSPGSYTSPVISGVTSGIYTVTVSGPQLGCLLSSTVQLNTLPLPTLTVAGNFSICAGNISTVAVTGANTYSWNTGFTGSQLSVSPATNTSYSVTGTNTQGCSTTSVVAINVLACTGLAEISEDQSPVHIYPNPNNGYLVIDTKLPARLCLYDPLGRVIKMADIESGEQVLDLNAYSSGIYLLKLSIGNTVIIDRVIKK